MKLLIVLFLVVASLVTLEAFAANMTGTTRRIGGTGNVAVDAPTLSATVAWTTNASGQVTGADVTWTPSSNADYTIRVVVGSSTGTASVVSSGVVSRTDSVTISPAVEADSVTQAKVVIFQN